MVKELFKANRKVLLLCLVLLLCVTATVTAAFLHDETSPIVNLFKMTAIDVDVVEEFDGEAKTSVELKNTARTKEFVRAALVINWQNEDGQVSPKSVLTTDYTLPLNTEDWFTDGSYYYFKEALEPEELTTNLLTGDGIKLTTAGQANVPEGFHLAVEIVAQGIQSDPEDAVETSWGVEADGDVISLGGGD